MQPGSLFYDCYIVLSVSADHVFVAAVDINAFG